MSFHAARLSARIGREGSRERRRDPRPEIDDDGDERPDVEQDVEEDSGLRETGKEALREREMRRRRDGQELGQPLHDAEQDGLADGHRHRRIVTGGVAIFGLLAGRSEPGASARKTSRPSVSARAVGGRPASATAETARSRPQSGVSAFTSVLRRDVKPAEATRSASSASGHGAVRHELEDGRSHLRRRRKIAPRDVEEPARGRVRADVERQKAVGVASRLGDDPVRDLLLDHDDEAGEEIRPPHERAQHRRGALVREIADERHGRARADPREGGLDVGLEHVGRLHEERPLGELVRKARRQHRIDLEGEDARAPVEERPRERAAAGPDLDDGLPLPGSQGIENFFDRRNVDEEVLAPAGPGKPRA